MQRFFLSARVRLYLALGVSSIASGGLFLLGAWKNHSYTFGYLAWNLTLAWVALAVTLWLESVLHRRSWSSWYAMFVTAVWLVFLPNTFYMISDFIHLQILGRADVLYDVVMFASFILNGVVLGFLSLFVVHQELLKRLRSRPAGSLIALVILICSFAIYIGRELRWNTWDIITNPASLLIDVSDRVLNPREHPQALTTTASFFVLLMSLYAVFWYSTRLSRIKPRD